MIITQATAPDENDIVIEMTPEQIAARQQEEAAYSSKLAQYIATEKYKDDRRRELSELDGEALDAIRKQIEALISLTEAPITPEWADYMAKVTAIKSTYPKP